MSKLCYNYIELTRSVLFCVGGFWYEEIYLYGYNLCTFNDTNYAIIYLSTNDC